MKTNENKYCKIITGVTSGGSVGSDLLVLYLVLQEYLWNQLKT